MVSHRPGMQSAAIHASQLRNHVQTVVLLAGMAALLGALGWALGGAVGVVSAAVLGVAGLFVGARASAHLLLRLYGARPILPAQADSLYAIAGEIAARAGLAAVPPLFHVPSAMMQAFSVELRRGPAIAVTDGLLRGMSAREVAAVLAHEISHIRHRDIRIMTLADLVTKITRYLAFLGWILVMINLPLLVTGHAVMSWLAIVLLIAGPTVSALMQLALSRTREFDADLGAARLTGDPDGLASALVRLERYQGRYWEQMVLPGYRLPEPSLLRSHPETAERVRRLAALPPGRPLDSLSRMQRPAPPSRVAITRAPRWRRTGLWY